MEQNTQPSCDVCSIGGKPNEQPAFGEGPNISKADEELRKLELQGGGGKNIKFESLFEQKRAILVFIRHFNCYVCRDFVKEIGKQINFDDVKNANMNLYVVGCSDRKGLESFSKELKFPLDHLLTDPMRGIYSKLGMLRAKNTSELKGDGKASEETTSSLMGGLGWSLWKMITKGKRGDIYQLGGCYVFDTNGSVLFKQIDQNAVAHVSIKQIKGFLTEYGTSKK